MKRILYIADLHIEEITGSDKLVGTFFEKDKNFTSKFIQSVKENSKDNIIDKIIIAGDLANTASLEEYEKVKKFIVEICKGLNILNENVLIIPGNHDVSWKTCKIKEKEHELECLKAETQPTKGPNEFIEKYDNFKSFYDGFYGNNKIFDAEKSVVWNVKFDELKIILIGLNTNERVSHLEEDHYGYLDHSKVNNEINAIRNKNVGYNIIIFSHHIITSTNEMVGSIKNIQEILPLLRDIMGISTFFCGHQHVGGAVVKQEENASEIFAFGVGSLAKIGTGVQNTYCLYDFNTNEEGVFLSKHEYIYIEGSLNKNWIEFNSSDFKIYRQETKELISDVESTEIFNIPIDIKLEESDNIESPRLVEYSQKFLEIVRDENLLKSGHFHWSPKTRTLGAIDTSKLFSKFSNLSLAKSAIFDLVQEKELTPELVIGHGMQGVLLTANMSSLLKCKTSYSPPTSNKVYHSKFEINIDLTDITKIALVNDVTSTGLSIKELLDDNIELFKKIEVIYLISIFYVSKKKDYNHKIFKDIDERIEFYSVCNDIKIDDCSYIGDDFNKCKTLCHGLDSVYKFY